MQLVINISDKDLKSVADKIFTISEMYETTQGRVYSAILNGIPLPKGHTAMRMAYKALEQEPCEDCISRQAAIDAFERFIHELGIKDEPYNYGEMALSARNVPPVNPKEPKTKWIPVSERLPEKTVSCLVSVGKLHLTQIAVYSDLMGTINHKIFYQGDYGHNNFKDITQYVNAWMPLPEPYKAESEG